MQTDFQARFQHKYLPMRLGECRALLMPFEHLRGALLLSCHIWHLVIRSPDTPWQFERLIAVVDRVGMLVMSGNAFSGTLPKSMDQLASLKELLIHANEFSGTVSDGWVLCTQWLCISCASLAECSRISCTRFHWLGTALPAHCPVSAHCPAQLLIHPACSARKQHRACDRRLEHQFLLLPRPFARQSLKPW